MKVYLDGRYLEQEAARVSVLDRGFLLADGVYEVSVAYRGRLFRLDRHLERLAQGMRALRIQLDTAPLEEVHRRLLAENAQTEVPATTVYIQVTRGVAPRSHGFPSPPATPTVFACVNPWSPPGPERWERGFAAITVRDERWRRVDIKSIALLANVLAQQAAIDAGADESILVRDGLAFEGAHSNLFAVRGDAIATHPTTHEILAGVTREAVIELARDRGFAVEERPLPLEELAAADEVFLTGTTTEVRPITMLDGRPVGSGTPGPVTRELQAAYRALVGA